MVYDAKNVVSILDKRVFVSEATREISLFDTYEKEMKLYNFTIRIKTDMQIIFSMRNLEERTIFIQKISIMLFKQNSLIFTFFSMPKLVYDEFNAGLITSKITKSLISEIKRCLDIKLNLYNDVFSALLLYFTEIKEYVTLQYRDEDLKKVYEIKTTDDFPSDVIEEIIRVNKER